MENMIIQSTAMDYIRCRGNEDDENKHVEPAI